MFLDYKKTFVKNNTVTLLEVVRNEREPQHILTNMFNTRDNNTMSMKINNETVRMETYQPRISTNVSAEDFNNDVTR